MNKLQRTKRFLQEYLPLLNKKFSKETKLEGDAHFALILSDKLSEVKIGHAIKAITFDSEAAGNRTYFAIEIHGENNLSGKYFDSAGDMCRDGFPKFKTILTINWHNLLSKTVNGKSGSTLTDKEVAILNSELANFAYKLFNWEFIDSMEVSSKGVITTSLRDDKQVTKHNGKLKDKPIYNPAASKHIPKSTKTIIRRGALALR